MLQRRGADVLISDIGMPDEDGYSLLRQVRALDGNRAREIPAVALTAFARPEDRSRALAAGFQRHMAKPIDPAEFTDVVAQVIAGTRR
jgi:CheY-like chemotaxis protein